MANIQVRIGIFSWILLFYSLSSIQAQLNDSLKTSNFIVQSKLLGLSGNCGLFYVRDMSTSPLTYKGLMTGGECSFTTLGPKFLSDITYQIDYGLLHNAFYPQIQTVSYAYTNQLTINLATRILNDHSNNGILYLGGQILFLGNFRTNENFDNADFNYEILSLIGPVMYYKKEFHLLNKIFGNKSFQNLHKDNYLILLCSVQCPIIGESIRPPFSVVHDFPTGNNSELSLKNNSFVTIHTCFEIGYSLKLLYIFSKYINIGLSYQGYYYNFHPSINPVEGYFSTFSLSYIYRFKEKLNEIFHFNCYTNLHKWML